MRAIESAVSSDFDEAFAALILNECNSYVIRGFELNMNNAIGAVPTGLEVVVGGSAVLHGQSTESGTAYHIPSTTANEVLNPVSNDRVEGSFTSSAANYVGFEFVRGVDDTTTTTEYFWNPTSKQEITKTVPSAVTMDYKFVISSTGFDETVLPLFILHTNAQGEVEKIEDRRPMLFRLGTAGINDPDPYYNYPWTRHSTAARLENPSISDSTDSPFRGGDKQITTLKESLDAIMSNIHEIKGSVYWYSFMDTADLFTLTMDALNTQMTGAPILTIGPTYSAGLDGTSILNAGTVTLTGGTATTQASALYEGVTFRATNNGFAGNITLEFDGVSTVDQILAKYSAGQGKFTHSALVPGQLNWNSDIFLDVVTTNLSYEIAANPSGSDTQLDPDQVAYLTLKRNEPIDDDLEFVNLSDVVRASNTLSTWVTDAGLVEGDFIRSASEDGTKYYRINLIGEQVDDGTGNMITVNQDYAVTLSEIFAGDTVTGAGYYTWGKYATASHTTLTDTDRHMEVADINDVPLSPDLYWLALRKDNGYGSGDARIYLRGSSGGELEQGEDRQISDNQTLDVVDYVGAASEIDTTPDYTNALVQGEQAQTTMTFVNTPVDPGATGTATSFLLNRVIASSPVVDSLEEQYYIYATVDGNGYDPRIANRTGIKVELLSTDSPTQQAAKIKAAIDAKGINVTVTTNGGSIVVTNNEVGEINPLLENHDFNTFSSVTVNEPGAGTPNYIVVDDEDLTKAIKRLDGMLTTLLSILQEDCYREYLTIVDTAVTTDPELYDNEFQATDGTAPNLFVPVDTIIDLPFDSRHNNRRPLYGVNSGVLSVFLNGQLLIKDDDYVEVDSSGGDNESWQIETKIPLYERWKLEFRFCKGYGGAAGGLAGGGGGGLTEVKELARGDAADTEVITSIINQDTVEHRRLQAGDNVTLAVQPSGSIRISSTAQTSALNIVNTSTSTTLATDTDTLICSEAGADIVVTLPDMTDANVRAAMIGKPVNIKKVGAGSKTTIRANTNEILDGVNINNTPWEITTRYECLTIMYDGTVWWII